MVNTLKILRTDGNSVRALDDIALYNQIWAKGVFAAESPYDDFKLSVKTQYQMIDEAHRSNTIRAMVVKVSSGRGIIDGRDFKIEANTIEVSIPVNDVVFRTYHVDSSFWGYLATVTKTIAKNLTQHFYFELNGNLENIVFKTSKTKPLATNKIIYLGYCSYDIKGAYNYRSRGDYTISYTSTNFNFYNDPNRFTFLKNQAKGEDGKDGVDGKDGKDGKDGITPNLTPIENDIKTNTNSIAVNKNNISANALAITTNTNDIAIQKARPSANLTPINENITTLKKDNLNIKNDLISIHKVFLQDKKNKEFMENELGVVYDKLQAPQINLVNLDVSESVLKGLIENNNDYTSALRNINAGMRVKKINAFYVVGNLSDSNVSKFWKLLLNNSDLATIKNQVGNYIRFIAKQESTGNFNYYLHKTDQANYSGGKVVQLGYDSSSDNFDISWAVLTANNQPDLSAFTVVNKFHSFWLNADKTKIQHSKASGKVVETLETVFNEIKENIGNIGVVAGKGLLLTATKKNGAWNILDYDNSLSNFNSTTNIITETNIRGTRKININMALKGGHYDMALYDFKMSTPAKKYDVSIGNANTAGSNTLIHGSKVSPTDINNDTNGVILKDVYLDWDPEIDLFIRNNGASIKYSGSHQAIKPTLATPGSPYKIDFSGRGKAKSGNVFDNGIDIIIKTLDDTTQTLQNGAFITISRRAGEV